MKTLSFASLVLAAGLALATTSVPSRVDACGGCFIPPERVQAVTDHRMVLSVGTRETILWDQFRYTGAPSEFAWVLPVTGDARVELASSAFFDLLDGATAVTVSPPACMPTAGGCGAASPSRAGFTGAEGVMVLRQEVVGPYDTVVLRATGADVLTAWLGANGFSIPSSITPIIAHYTAMRSDFVALKLRPGESVQAMQPVRVRMQSASMTLPLRMVSAGITDKVGITLWIFGPGRWEAENFPNAEIARSSVVWDWSTSRSNYRTLVDNALTADRRTWLTEMSEPASSYTNFTERRFFGPGQTQMVISAADQQAAQQDFAIAAQGNLRDYWISRLRADLPASMLDRDLLVRAAASSVVLPAAFTVVRTTGPAPNGCPNLGNAGCTALPVSSAGRAIPALPFVLAGLAIAARSLTRSRRARPST
ncbi:MAG: DUF2330 domain-containing protein [Myxococcales bacterium]|nr:DUF2330 domain-containing protein [Myxococcales bacterium]